MLHNGPYLLGNGPHVKVNLHWVLCRIRDFVVIGIMSLSGLCRYRDYVVRDYVTFGIRLFGIMSHSGLCCWGLCRSRNYVAFGISSVVRDCVIRVNIARVFVVRDYVV